MEGREPLAVIAAVGSSSGMCSDSDDAGRRQKKKKKKEKKVSGSRGCEMTCFFFSSFREAPAVQ